MDWCYDTSWLNDAGNKIRVVLDFGSGIAEILQFFRNPAKSGSRQIPNRRWWMPLQLHYVELITDKTDTGDLSSGVLISVTVTQTKEI